MNYATDLTQLIGHTPLVKLNKLAAGGFILCKLEMFNPYSVKDRPALTMLQEAEKRGLLKPGATIIEPTSGNTGIGLAFIAAVKGYKIILTMPASMSPERVKLLKALGAQIVLTPAATGMPGAIEKAQQLLQNTPNSFQPGQFDNPANPAAHKSTAEEIWNDTDGKIDIFVATVGTGGTITGVGHYLKQKNPAVKIVAVEPAASAVLEGRPAGPHKIQGIGAGFIPSILDMKVIDEIIPVTDEDAGKTARALATQEGILAGISGGAAVWAAQQQAANPENKNKLIVTLLPDTGERYLSTWLFEN